MNAHRSIIAAAALLLISTRVAVAQPERPIGILIAAGDISTCGSKAWHGYADKTADLIRKTVKDASEATPPIPVRVLVLGDLAYGKGTAEQFKCFGKRWSGFDDVVLPVPGNHEYLTAAAAPYFEHFKKNPIVNQNGPSKGYFAVNFPRAEGPWRLIGLNAHLGVHAMKQQMDWLADAVDAANPANRADCVLAFWHAPTFSSGRHGHDYKTDPKTPLTKNRPMRTAFHLLHQHGATTILAGHDHDYEQFAPQDADGNAAADGVRQFVVGTGGSILTEDVYDHMAPNSEGVFGRTKGVQGVLKIELFEKRYRWQFLSIDPNKSIALKTTEAECTARKKPPA